MPKVLTKTVERLRRLVSRGQNVCQTDRQLLQRFAKCSDEEAFGALVRRHGALVLGVCRRVLGQAQDAEDAFQATFLVLARKAGKLHWQDCVKNWLHGVAYRVSLKARSRGLRRKQKEQQAVLDVASPNLESQWDGMRGLLDEELAKLPAKYRAPLLLCYLEGKTRDEAAEELGWSPGSVKGRLERGRELLRQRLLRRGLPLSAVLCASFLAESAATAAVPPALFTATVEAGLAYAAGSVVVLSDSVLQLAQGVINAMLIAKVKTSMIGLCLVAVLGLGSSWIAQSALADRSDSGAVVAPADPFAQDGERKKDGERAQEKGKKDGERPKEGDKRPRDGETPGVRVLFRSADLEKGTITVAGARDGDRGELTYSLAKKDIPVTTSTGHTVKLNDLRQNTLLVLQLSKLDDVEAIRVQMPVLNVELDQVLPDVNKLSFKAERQARILDVAKDAKLLLNGKPSKLGDFEAGQRVQLTLSLDRATVLAMTRGEERPVEGKRDKEGERPGPGRPQWSGVLIDVLPEKNHIEILIGGNEDPWVQSFVLSKEVKIQWTFEGMTKDMEIKDLAKPMRVGAVVAQDKKTVTRLEVYPPVLRTILSRVDAGSRTIVAGEKKFTLAADTPIRLGRDNIGIDKLAAGQRAVLVLSTDRSQVIAVLSIRADGERE
ncbi:MAG: sigma-70 family RNA polymerase sigma factor [Gemmataceae bacterium]|nr:sigma-70 family RNA polymerase sigma factor [Gemmataceae bacterium]MCI0740877.1 sigma-70 family RNA polymerase sigma factor [Gemmataceae bacterium]